MPSALHQTFSLLTLVAVACAPAKPDSTAGQRPDEELWRSEGVRPSVATITGYLHRRDLVESSGAALSATQPGVLFTINDSGNEPILYATDSSGADRGAWRVTGATNVDWESIAIGPCAGDGGPGSVSAGPPRCVYIGDTGDNDARHAARAIYRIPEPTATAAGRTGATAPAERVSYAYEGGPRDVEALTVGASGEIALYTKRPLRDARGALRPALVFRLPSTVWASATRATAALADSLPAIHPGGGPGASLVTDAALRGDGRRVAVRTYTTVYVYASDPATGRIAPGARPAICDVSAVGGDTGEGITWTADGRLLLTSEGRASSVDVVRCADADDAR